MVGVLIGVAYATLGLIVFLLVRNTLVLETIREFLKSLNEPVKK